jgi:glutathione synthase/RimK-type ligase-like ATP-grasp enzyme
MIRRPTVSIEMDGRLSRPRILRGTRLTHRGISGKLEQSTRLEAHGVAVPKWIEISGETKLDPQEWGPYVVVKPSRGKRGAYVWVHRTGRVRFKPPAEFPEGHPGREGPMIAQKFIYTGRWPVGYRVVTFFGRVVAAVRYEGRKDLAPLDGSDAFRTAGGGISIVASAKGCSIDLTSEPDVLDLARRAHAAVPEIPSLGIDIVREEGTGALYVLEINPGGQAWILTNDSGIEMQAQFGFDFYPQFNALDVIADRSIEIARTYAS